MELNSILETSLILQNWQYLTIALLVIIFVNYYRNVNKQKSTTKSKSQREQLAGAEDVGANFNDDDDSAGPTASDDDAFTPALEDKPHVPYMGASVTMPGGATHFYEMVNNRRSVRAFSNNRIPPAALVEQCIRAAGTAPSGAHTEPWTFCLIGRDNASLRQQIREIVEGEEQLNYAQRMHRQWRADLRPLRTNHVKEYLTEAPYLLLVFKQTYGVEADGRRRQHYYHEISVAIATGILLCALQAAGLSSLVTTPLNCGPALRTLLDRPPNEKLLVLLPVGYAAEECCVPDLKRKDLADILVKY